MGTLDLIALVFGSVKQTKEMRRQDSSGVTNICDLVSRSLFWETETYLMSVPLFPCRTCKTEKAK